MDVDAKKLELQDSDLKDSSPPSVASCEALCNGASGCVAIRWHEVDKHCHLLTGKAVTGSAFEAALSSHASYDACVLVKQGGANM